MTVKSGKVYFSEQSGSFVFPESVSVFGFSISFFGVFLVLAALVGIFVTIKAARKKQQNIEWMLTLLTWVVVAAIIGARIYYVIFHWQFFMKHPVEVFYIRNGGLSYFGALFGAWFAVKRYCGSKKTDFLQWADTLCLGATAAAPFVWLGCALGREPIGKFSEGLFSIKISADYLPSEMETEAVGTLLSRSRVLDGISYVSVHPVALYGVILAIVILLVLLFLSRKEKTNGTMFHVYLLAVSISHFVLECFRGDSCCIWGTKIPTNCVAAVVIVVTIAAGWYRNRFMVRNREKRTYKNMNEY